MPTVPLYAKSPPVTTRGLDANIWRGSLAKYVANDTVFGARIHTDFTEPYANTTDASNEGDWFIQDAAAGGTSESFLTVANPDGIVDLSAATGTDHFGIEAHWGRTATTAGVVALPTHSTLARGRVVYQTRINLKNMDNFFIGLSEPIVEFLSATGTLPDDSDYIGFRRLDGDTLVFESRNDNDGGTAVEESFTVQTKAEMDALEDATDNFCNLAFAVDSDNNVHIGFNGLYFGPTVNGIGSTSLPIESLTPKYAVTRGATDDLANVSLEIDSLDVFIETITD